MEVQTEESRLILEVFGELNKITGQVKNSSAEMLQGSREVLTEGENLEVAAQEITGGVTDMEKDTDQINSAVSEVNEVSKQNSKIVDNLIKAVSHFKID